jgi:hypothetical protein
VQTIIAIPANGIIDVPPSYGYVITPAFKLANPAEGLKASNFVGGEPGGFPVEVHFEMGGPTTHLGVEVVRSDTLLPRFKVHCEAGRAYRVIIFERPGETWERQGDGTLICCAAPSSVQATIVAAWPWEIVPSPVAAGFLVSPDWEAIQLTFNGDGVIEEEAPFTGATLHLYVLSTEEASGDYGWTRWRTLDVSADRLHILTDIPRGRRVLIVSAVGNPAEAMTVTMDVYQRVG